MITAKHAITSPINILLKDAQKRRTEYMRQDYREPIPLSRKHNEVFSSFTEELQERCFVSRRGQAGRGGGHFKSHVNSKDDDSHCVNALCRV